MRTVGLWLGVAACVLIPFLLWGEQIGALFTPETTFAWFRRARSWAWLIGLALLAADLVLPLPGTIIMSALGYVYGPLVGGLLSALGSTLSGALGYLLCRRFGRGMALALLGADELARSERAFAAFGGWLVALSRWMPVVPEVVACLAGLARMPPPLFFAALVCGALPFGFVFAAVGAAGTTSPGLALALSVGLPALLWLIVHSLYRKGAYERYSNEPGG